MLHALTVLGYLGKLKKGPGQSMFFACLFHINVSKRGRGKYKNLNIFRMESILVEQKVITFYGLKFGKKKVDTSFKCASLT